MRVKAKPVPLCDQRARVAIQPFNLLQMHWVACSISTRRRRPPGLVQLLLPCRHLMRSSTRCWLSLRLSCKPATLPDSRRVQCLLYPAVQAACQQLATPFLAWSASYIIAPWCASQVLGIAAAVGRLGVHHLHSVQSHIAAFERTLPAQQKRQQEDALNGTRLSDTELVAVSQVLILDAFTKDVVAPLLRVNDLRRHGVTLHLALEVCTHVQRSLGL